MTESSQTIAIVGGGIAGLAAAEACLAAGGGSRVILVEPAPRYGGVLETVRRDGWLVERSADNILAARPEGLDLVARLGLTEELMPVAVEARRALVWCRGKALPVPQGFRLLAPGDADGIRATAILSAEGRARVLAERSIAPREGDGDESLESFALRRLGREAFDRLVQPLVAGIWTADPARLSMAAACPEFLAMERDHGSLSAAEEERLGRMGDRHRGEGARYGQFVTLAGGLGRLVERFVGVLRDAGIEERRGRVEALGRTADGRYRLALVGPDADAIVADGVILALPAPASGGVLATAEPALAAELRAIEYAGSVVVVVGYPRRRVAHPLDAAGLVIPRVEGRAALAVSFASSKFPGRAPADHVLLRVFFGGALDPARTGLDDAALVTLARTELGELVGASGPPSMVEIARWPGAMPQYHLGHLDRLARIESAVRGLPGLALAGAAYEGVGIPQVIGSGRRAAAQVLSALGSPTRLP